MSEETKDITTPLYTIKYSMGLPNIAVVYTPEEQELIAKVLSLLKDQKDKFNDTGMYPIDMQLEIIRRLIHHLPELGLQTRLQDAGVFEDFNKLIPLMWQRQEAARNALSKKK